MQIATHPKSPTALIGTPTQTLRRLPFGPIHGMVSAPEVLARMMFTRSVGTISSSLNTFQHRWLEVHLTVIVINIGHPLDDQPDNRVAGGWLPNGQRDDALDGSRMHTRSSSPPPVPPPVACQASPEFGPQGARGHRCCGGAQLLRSFRRGKGSYLRLAA